MFAIYNWVMKKKPIEENISALMETAVELLSYASYAVAFTGAGISTPSGIPDFRSPDTGLWNKNDPFKVASLYVFRHDPESFFNWIKPLAEKAEKAKPNAAHQSLAKMEQAGIIKSVITQNIDGLHQKAGSQNVLELHGSARTATCLNCGREHGENYFKDLLWRDDQMPTCKNCGKIIKPDVILIGEMLPRDTWNAAYQTCLDADLILVVGSSLEVSPANSLPETGIRNGAKLIINNLSATHLDVYADVILAVDVEKGVGEFWDRISEKN